jgi:regulator of cell morphogenesis and NO signaling
MSTLRTLTPNLTLNEVVRSVPSAITVFEEVEVDYCCQGERTLTDAAREAGYRTDELLARLENAEVAEAPQNWFEKPLSALTSFLISDHAATLGERLPAIRGLIEKAGAPFDEQPEELERIRLLLEHLAESIVTHAQNEERELFPSIEALELAARNGAAAPMLRITQRVLHELIEHRTFRDRLRTLRELADRLPDIEPAVALRAELRRFSGEVHRHMHLENNVLYPRAIEIENDLRRAAVAG